MVWRLDRWSPNGVWRRIAETLQDPDLDLLAIAFVMKGARAEGVLQSMTRYPPVVELRGGSVDG